jgi:hypothetical protein
MFDDAMKAINKAVPACKFIINQDGLTIYSQNTYARCELTTNAIIANEKVSICIRELQMLLRINKLVRKEHNGKYNDLKLFIDGSFLKFESKKVKAKVSTIKEDIIRNNISEKVTSVLTPIFEFTTDSETLKNINAHQFIFPDVESGRIYIRLDDTMEKNTVYAELNNKNNDFSNSLTMKLGDVVVGALDRELIIDFERLMLFNIVESENIVIKLMDRNVLVSEINMLNEKTDSHVFMKIYNSMRKS